MRRWRIWKQSARSGVPC